MNKKLPAGFYVFSFLLTIFCFFIITVNPGYADQPVTRAGKIAILPFENFSDDKDALLNVIPQLRTQLEQKGYEVLDDNSLNVFLLRERVRSTGYISADLAQKLGRELGINAILLGSVNAFAAKENPAMGIAARLIDPSNGQVLWANHISASGDDFASILDLGRIQSMDRLIPKVIGKLIASFSTAPPLKESVFKVAVMPFQNKSKKRDAGMVITYMVLTELFRSQRFAPVEYGEIRKAIIDLRIRNKGELDYQSMEALSLPLDVDGIILGTLELYEDRQDTPYPPEAGINMRLIDARNKKILWYDSYQMNGDDDITIFDWGKIRSVDGVAHTVVSKLIKKLDKAAWY